MISFQRRYQENTKLLTVCKWIADLLIVILLAYTLTLFLCDRTTISGNSMQPAIENEDTVLLNRIAYSFHGPKSRVKRFRFTTEKYILMAVCWKMTFRKMTF